MVPVEKNSLRMTASFVFVECCYDGPVAFQDFAVAFKKWCRAKFVCFVGDPECRRRFREKLRMKQPHRSVKMYSRLPIAHSAAWLGHAGQHHAACNPRRNVGEPRQGLDERRGLGSSWKYLRLTTSGHPALLPFGRGQYSLQPVPFAQRLSILSSIRCSRASAEVVGMPVLAAAGFPSAAARPVGASVRSPNGCDPVPWPTHGEMPREQTERSVNTSHSENLANFREAYHTLLARVSPRWGASLVHIPIVPVGTLLAVGWLGGSNPREICFAFNELARAEVSWEGACPSSVSRTVAWGARCTAFPYSR